MATTTAHRTRPHRRLLHHYAVIVAIILALAAGVLAGYAWGDTTSASSTDWNVPVPFKDGYVPAQPM